jgi:hypothetical protein
MVIDEKNEDQIDTAVAQGELLGGGAHERNAARGRRRGRDFQHPLGAIEAAHRRAEDLAKQARETPDAAPEIEDPPHGDCA